MPDFATALDAGRGLLTADRLERADPAYARGVMRRLVECLEQARPTQTDFVELPKDHLFTAEQAEARKRWAMEFIPKFAGVARGLGYGVFVGGTLVRDIDLIALPWRDPLPQTSPDLFVLELCHCLPLMMGNRGETLYGHRWYALWETSHRDHQIDLKVILPAARGIRDPG